MEHRLILLLAELGAVLGVALFLGALAERLCLPAIAGQLCAGVVLGPSVLGTFLPHLEGALFPPHDAVLKEVRVDFLQVGLLLFIFFVGLEIDIGLLGRRWRVVLPVSGLGMVIPFIVGFTAVVLAPSFWAGPNKQALPWVIAVCVSISALPVIAAIITDLEMVQTHVGQMILSAAVIDDLCGWLGFAAVAAAFAETGKGHTTQTHPLVQLIILVLGAFLVAITVGRMAGTRAGRWVDAHGKEATVAVGAALACALVASALAEGLGAHAFFGALLVGLALSGGHGEFLRPVARIVRSFFAPLYFGAVAVSVNVFASFDLVLVLVVFLVACLGKLIGVTAGARLGGLGWRPSLAIASGMNARGAIEILLAVLALSVGLIDSRIFVAIVVMALATSILAGFFLQAIVQPPAARARPDTPPAQPRRPLLQPSTTERTMGP